MKMTLIVLVAVIVVAGAGGMIAWSQRPQDESEIKRAHADLIMCQTYGTNWQGLFSASIREHTPNKAMADTFERAIGNRPAK